MGDLITEYPIFDMTKKEEWNPPGRPLKFTPEEFERRVNQYFRYCEEKKKPLTLERLATFLNCDSETIRDYKHRDEFFATIKRLREYILANKVETMLSGKGSTIGYIFDLKNNHGWKDKQEIETTGDGPVNIIIKEGQSRKMKNITPEPTKAEAKQIKIEDEE